MCECLNNYTIVFFFAQKNHWAGCCTSALVLRSNGNGRGEACGSLWFSIKQMLDLDAEKMLVSQNKILSRLKALEQKTSSGTYVTSNCTFTLAPLFLQNVKLKYLE